MFFIFFFFFSSRRRHTRFSRDWSSDVCSSDLGADASGRSVYQAPEGVWAREVDRVRVDVFDLGAAAYYLLTRRAPAADANALRERLSRDKGLDLAADLPQVLSSLRALILDATRPAVGERLPTMAAFL